MTKPVRLQLSRKRGFNLQELSRATNGLDVAKVARPSMFGNPFTIHSAVDFHQGFGQPVSGETPRETAVRWFRDWINGEHELHPESMAPPSREEIQRALRGKNLACWCRSDQPCHADILLAIANAPLKMTFREHIPNFVDRAADAPSEFTSLDQLLAVKKVSGWRETAQVIRFSFSARDCDDLLIAEMMGGEHWVIGYVTPPGCMAAFFPEWKSPR